MKTAMNYCRKIFIYTIILGLYFLPKIQAQAGTVTGIMQMQDGSPMAGGKVIVFIGDESPPPLLTEDYRMPEFAEDLDNEGTFKINLQAGTYYFGAVKWLDGRGPGKPGKGDSFFLMRTRPIQIPAEGVVDLGTIPRGEIIR